MNFKKLGTAVLAMTMVFAFVRCGATRDDGTGDAGNTKKDGGAPAPDADISNIPPDASTSNSGDDGGTNIDPDGGTTTTTVETTVPDIANLNSANHPMAGKAKVHFKAVATSKMWRVLSHKTNNVIDYCLEGVFVADANATTPEYNGVLVVSKTTKTKTSTTGSVTCDESTSVIPSTVNIGDELDVTGFYDEYCGFRTMNTCNDKEAGGKDITFPEITSNFPGQVTISMAGKGLPSSLPATVTIDQVNSTGCMPPYTLGTDWFKYRAVLVKVSNVTQTVHNPDQPPECTGGSSGDFCEWRIAPQGATTPSVRVDDALMFAGTTCPDRPAASTNLNSLTGIVYWTFGNSKLLPRAKTDADPNLP